MMSAVFCVAVIFVVIQKAVQLYEFVKKKIKQAPVLIDPHAVKIVGASAYDRLASQRWMIGIFCQKTKRLFKLPFQRFILDFR